MKMKLILANLVTAQILFTLPAYADNYMVIMGAGGEEAKPGTIFDGGIRNLATYARNSPGLKVDVALNGGHPETTQIVENEFPRGTPTSQFREVDYKRLIQKYTQMLKDDQIKSGDQLMIYIDSHGGEKEAALKTHRISTAEGTAVNLDSLEGSETVSLDALEALKDLAKTKHVKMAIIDASCHSGNTIALADENTCVVSSSGPNHYGYTSFGYAFPNAMSKGKTLEEVFLDVRNNENAPSFPMISTNEGMSVYNELYTKLTPFLYDYDEKNDKLTPFLLRNNSEAQMCLTDANFKSLIQTIDGIEEMNTVTKKILWWTYKNKEVDFSELKRLLTQYKKTLDDAALKMREIGTEQFRKKETIQGFVGEVTWKDLLMTDYNELITKASERLRTETNEKKRTALANNILYYTRANEKKQNLLNTESGLAATVNQQKELMRSLSDTKVLSGSIAREERKLYDIMYKQAQKANPDKSQNPCHNFKL